MRRAAVLVGLLLVTACSSDPEPERTTEITYVPGFARQCAGFLDALPDTLADEARAEVDDPADSPPVAAYGEPPILVACGVAEPEGFGPGASCEIANRSRWFIPEEQYGDEPREITITAAWNRPRVQVIIPADYWPNATAAVMARLAPIVRELRQVGGKCY